MQAFMERNLVSGKPMNVLRLPQQNCNNRDAGRQAGRDSISWFWNNKYKIIPESCSLTVLHAAAFFYQHQTTTTIEKWAPRFCCIRSPWMRRRFRPCVWWTSWDSLETPLKTPGLFQELLVPHKEWRSRRRGRNQDPKIGSVRNGWSASMAYKRFLLHPSPAEWLQPKSRLSPLHPLFSPLFSSSSSSSSSSHTLQFHFPLVAISKLICRRGSPQSLLDPRCVSSKTRALQQQTRIIYLRSHQRLTWSSWSFRIVNA